MRTHLLWASLTGVLVVYLGGCAVVAPVPPGEVMYEPPAVVEAPAVSVWAWWPWPHYEVEHNYVVENDRVIIRDRHYFPTYGRTRPYIRNDSGRHRGWYKHER